MRTVKAGKAPPKEAEIREESAKKQNKKGVTKKTHCLVVDAGKCGHNEEEEKDEKA